MVSISDNDDISDTARYPLVKAHGTWNRFLIYYYYYAVMSMYTGAKTVVRTVYGNSKGFEVKVGMHQQQQQQQRPFNGL